MPGGEIATLFARIGCDLTGLTSGLASTKTMLTSAGQAMQSAGMTLTAGLTVPLVGMGVAAAKAATDLDTQMRNIQSISKDSDADIAALSQRFVTMSTDLTKTTDTAKNLAAGFYQIQSSGFSGEDAMKILEASTKAASAGLTDTETAVKAIAATLNAYSLDASEATHVSDVLFKSVDVGVFSFSEIAGAIGDTLGAAAASKVPIEELGAAFSTMTKAGINVNEAATSINQLMLSYIKPSEGALKAAAALGIEMSASALQSKGLSGVMKDLAQHTQLWTTVATGADEPLKAQQAAIEAQRAELEKWKLSLQSTGEFGKEASAEYGKQTAALKLQAMGVKEAMESNIDYSTVMNNMAKATGLTVDQLAELFPNVRALRGALSLTREGGEAFTSDLEAMYNATGATTAAFAEQTKSWAAQWDNFKNVGTAALIELGNIIMPVVTDFMKNGVMPLIQMLRDADPEWIKWGLAIGGVLIALGPVLMIVGTLATVLGFLLSPIGLVVVAAGLLGVAFATNFGGIRDMAMAFWNGTLLPVFTELQAWLKEIIPVAIQAMSDFWTTTLLPAIQAVWAWIQSDLIPLFVQVWDILANGAAQAIPQVADYFTNVLIPTLLQLWSWIQTNIFPLLAQLWAWFAANLPGAIQTVVNFFVNVLLPGIIAVNTWVLTNLVPTLNTIWQWLQVNVPAAIQTLSNFWQTVLLPAIQTVANWVTGTLIPTLQTVWDWLSTNVPAAIQTLSDYWTTTLLPAITSVWEWMSTVLFPFFTALADFFGAIFDKALEATAGLWQNVVLPAIKSVWQWMSENLFPILKTIGDYISATFNTALKAIGTTIDILRPIVDGLISGTLNALKGAFDGITGAIQGVTSWLGTMADKISNLKLPDWLTPGSPTPFELGLRGIADALSDVDKALPDIGMRFPTGGGNGGTSSVDNSQTIWQVSLNAANGQDSIAQMQALAGAW